MKTKFVVKALAAVLLIAGMAVPAYALRSGPDAGGYYMVDSNDMYGPAYAYQDISATGTAFLGADDSFINVPIGFTFNFYGTAYTTVDIVSNGYLNFDQNGNIEYRNLETSTGVSKPIVLPFDPLDPYAGGVIPTAFIAPNFVDQNPASVDPIYYQTLGTAPNRVFIVQFKVPHIDLPLEKYDYQVILYEGSDEILFQYNVIANTNPQLTNGSFSTVGIQGSATAGTNYQSGQADWWNTASVGNNSGILASGLAVLFTKTAPAALPAAAGGGGCSLDASAGFDPLFGMLLLLALGALYRRRNDI